jgi:hypothetical protein
VLALGLTRTFLVHPGLQLPDVPPVTGRLGGMKHVVRVIPLLRSRANVAILPMRKLRNHPGGRSPHGHDGPKLRGVAAGASEFNEVSVRNDFAV